MDLILRNARTSEHDTTVDIGIDGEIVAAIEPALAAEGEEIDLGGRLVAPGLIETHIHLDKSRIIERCTPEVGRAANNMARVSEVKESFTVEDVHARARESLEGCILNGASHMRTHVEVDPKVGLRGFEGVKRLIEEYRWAIDVEICVFPQEGLTNNPGTDELMVAALAQGAKLVGAAPRYDSNSHGQIDRVFEIAREYEVDIDMHLDFGHTTDSMDIDHVIELTERFGYGGRVTVGHMTTLSVMPPAELRALAQRLADTGIAVTVLPATDLFLMGRHQEHSVMRGVAPAHELVKHGVNCSLSSNNILNPFTPLGDGSLIRMANLYANVCQVSLEEDLAECFEMLTRRSAKILGLEDYGVAAGRPADLVVFDCETAARAVATVAAPLMGFKRGRRTFTRQPAALHRPD